MDDYARQYLPGDDTRTAVFFEPYPLYVADENIMTDLKY
jgi:hypothetical protein